MADRRGVTLWFPLIVAVYFVAQTVIRLWVGPGVQLDESELLVMARDFRLGYGPQQPLYNWVQASAFALFGVNVAAMVVTKNLCLWGIYMLVFFGLRRFCDPLRAMLATLGLIFVPTVVWEAQRTLSHSVALLSTCAAFLWAMTGLLRRRTWRGWVLMGIILGLGGLSKSNFWLLPVAMALALLTLPRQTSQQSVPVWQGLLVAVLITGAIIAGPLWWSVTNPDLALMSVGKLYRGEDSGLNLGVFNAAADTLVAVVATFVLLAPLAFVARRLARGQPAPEDTVWLRQIMIRGMGIGIVIIAVGMTIAGANRVSPRWLLPVALPGALGIVLWALEPGVRRAGRVIGGAAAVVAGVVLIGITVVFGFKPSRLSDDMAPVAAQIRALGETIPVTGAMRDMGALLAVDPRMPVRAEPPLGPKYSSGPLLRLGAMSETPSPPAEGAVLVQVHKTHVPNLIDAAKGQDMQIELWQLP